MPKKVNRFYSGYISGTNRGSVLISIRGNEDNLRAVVLLDDNIIGPAILSLKGSLIEHEANFRLMKFMELTEARPLDGQIILKFNEDYRYAEGTWKTDIGTTGNCKIEDSKLYSITWFLKFIWRKVKISSSEIYLPLLIIIAILNLIAPIKLSYASLLLLGIPAIYIYRKNIAELIEAFGIQEIGFIKLKQKPLPELFSRIKGLPPESIEIEFDKFFVPRTKYILTWMAKKGSTDRIGFFEGASSLGIPSENIDVTLNALFGSGCLTIIDDKISITDLGKRYTEHLRLTGQIDADFLLML